jgi:hypothetical protein
MEGERKRARQYCYTMLYNQLTIANPPLTLTKLNKGVAGNHRGRGRGREAISISYHMMQ